MIHSKELADAERKRAKTLRKLALRDCDPKVAYQLLRQAESAEKRAKNVGGIENVEA